MLRCVAHNVLQRARAPPAGSQGEVQGHQVSAGGKGGYRILARGGQDFQEQKILTKGTKNSRAKRVNFRA